MKILDLTKESFWVFLGQAGVAVAGIMGVKLLTHVLNQAEYGKLAIANTIISLIGANLFSPIAQGLIRFWPISKAREELDIFYTFVDKISRILSLVALFITLLVTVILLGMRNYDFTIFVSLSLTIGIIMGLYSFKVGIFRASRRRSQVALLDTTKAFLCPILGAILVLLTNSNVNMILVGYFLANICIFLIAKYIYDKMSSMKFNNEISQVPLFQGLGKEILSYSWPFFLWGLLTWVYISCDRWSLQMFYNSEVVGVFAVVAQLAMYPLIFGSGFLTAFFGPIAFQKARDFSDNIMVNKGHKILIIMTSIYFFGAVILIGFFARFDRPLVTLISNEKFATYSYLLPWLTLAWGFFYLGQLLTQFGALELKQQIYILPKIASSVVAAGSVFYFSFKLGPAGIVIGLSIAGFIYTIWCLVIALKILSKDRIV